MQPLIPIDAATDRRWVTWAEGEINEFLREAPSPRSGHSLRSQVKGLATAAMSSQDEVNSIVKKRKERSEKRLRDRGDEAQIPTDPLAQLWIRAEKWLTKDDSFLMQEVRDWLETHPIEGETKQQRRERMRAVVDAFRPILVEHLVAHWGYEQSSQRGG